MKALGWTDREIGMPIIGIVSGFNEIIPGHKELGRIVEAVKAGVREAGGNPVSFPVIGVCDGIAMGHTGMKYSLCSRELIRDSIEVMATAHPFDALVFVPNCDKIVPGMLMAAGRLDLPTVFCSGGPMLPGKLPGSDSYNKDNPYGGKNLSLTDMFEAVGAVSAGKCIPGIIPSSSARSRMISTLSHGCVSVSTATPYRCGYALRILLLQADPSSFRRSSH